jgi:hypothetical protein
MAELENELFTLKTGHLLVFSGKTPIFAIRLEKTCSYGTKNISTIDPQKKKQTRFP